MSAYRNCLHIASSESGQRLQLAADLLVHAKETVMIDNLLALRADPQGIICEVILAGSSEPRAQIETAKALLKDSSIGKYVHSLNLKWIAVEDYGTGTVQVWP